MALTSMHCSLVSQIQELQQQDTFCKEKIQALQQDIAADSKFSWKKDLLWHHNKIVIPEDSHIISQLLQEFHSTKVGGHSCSLKTHARLAQHFYWKKMRHDVAEFVKTSLIC